MSQGGEASSPVEAAGNLPASQLPWQQIPVFDAQTTDLQVYARKLQFLKEIWPTEHLAQLAPRAALQVQGVAFQKVARLDAAKLRSDNGVQYLVEALGGQWGKLATEEKLSLFEKALYQTSQKSDESNDSYLARHDLAFEDLVSKGVTLEEVRAYVLIRQSQLPAEDRKRIVVETGGDLTYTQARKSLRLLGSRFFQDLQGGSRNNRYKTYDTNVMDSPDETTLMAADWEPSDEEQVFQAMYEAGDEDAAFVADFEESIVDTVQESPELASCYHTYLEARTRLRERAKFRGFWGVTTQNKGKGKKSKGYGGKPGVFNKGKSLAEKIATSSCRRCGQAGHWKRECPLAQGQGKGEPKGKSPSGETITLAEALVTYPHDQDEGDHNVNEMMMELPENAENIGRANDHGLGKEEIYFGEHEESATTSSQHHHHHNHEPSFQFSSSPKCFNFHKSKSKISDTNGKELFKNAVQSLMTKNFEFPTSVKKSIHAGFQQKMQDRLHECCRKHGYQRKLDTTAVTSEPKTPDQQVFLKPAEPAVEVFLNMEERAGEAVIDTGASRSVIGEDGVPGLIKSLEGRIWGPLKKVPSSVFFRFGNSGTLQSQYALCIPRQQKGWIRVEVVPGQTPFLVSNAVLKEIGVLIDPRNQMLHLLDSERKIPLRTCRKNLLCVDLVDLLEVETQEEQKEEIYVVKNSEEESKFQGNKKHEKINCTPCIPPSCCMISKQVAHTIVQRPPYEPAQHQENIRENAASHQAQDHHPLTKESDRTQGNGARGLSPRRSFRRRGSRPEPGSEIHECSPRRGIQSSARNQNTGAVGSAEVSVRKTAGQNVLSGLQGGRWVSDAGEKQKGSVSMDEELSELPEGDVETSVPTSADTEHRPHQGPEDGPGIAQSKDLTIHGSMQPGQDRRDRVGEDSDDGDDNISQAQPSSDREGRESAPEHADRAQPEQDQDDSNPNRNSPTRTGHRDSAARGLVAHKVVARVNKNESERSTPSALTEGQVLMIHQEISNKMSQIQDGLSQMKQRHPVLGASKTQTHPISRPVDLLEVYCEEGSQITQQINRSGGRALRFTKKDGNLSTAEGINKLWMWVEAYEPEHIWVAPECRLWGSFSRFNMGRSETTKQRILDQRKTDVCHLKLCNDLYNHQVAQGKHFHLEQPRKSEMTIQPQLQDAMTGTLPAFFDTCQAGKLLSPNHEKFLQKRTQVRTTSRCMHKLLHNQNCPRDHEHEPIKGSVRDENRNWVKLSAYAAAYTSIFARRVARGIYESWRNHEVPLILEELLVGEELETQGETKKRPMAQEVLELRKCRKRHDGKGPPTPGDIAYDLEKTIGDGETLKEALKILERGVPRVGNSYCYLGDPRIEKLQRLIPDVEIRVILICRGTERHRIPSPRHFKG